MNVESHSQEMTKPPFQFESGACQAIFFFFFNIKVVSLSENILWLSIFTEKGLCLVNSRLLLERIDFFRCNFNQSRRVMSMGAPQIRLQSTEGRFEPARLKASDA